MNRDEILDVLRGRSGGVCPDRGVRADDILLGRYAAIPADGRASFWQAFSEALPMLWAEMDTEAIEAAAAFVSGLDKTVRPDTELVKSGFEFLFNDLTEVSQIASKGDERRRIVAALRMLANLGLGERNWWRCRFWSWIGDAKLAAGAEGQLAWQAVLHASLGLMNCSEPTPNIDAWLEDGRKAKEFPAIELFTLLVRQTEYQQDKEHLKNEVIEAYQSLYANCIGNSCPQGIDDIRSVIETWLMDRLHLSQDIAQGLLEWQKPSKELPQVRLASRKHLLAASHA